MTLNGDQSGFTRRQLLGLATLTTPGLAGAAVGGPQAKIVPKQESSVNPSRILLVWASTTKRQLENFGEAGQLVYSVGGVLVFIVIGSA